MRDKVSTMTLARISDCCVQLEIVSSILTYSTNVSGI